MREAKWWRRLTRREDGGGGGASAVGIGEKARVCARVCATEKVHQS